MKERNAHAWPTAADSNLPAYSYRVKLAAEEAVDRRATTTLVGFMRHIPKRPLEWTTLARVDHRTGRKDCKTQTI